MERSSESLRITAFDEPTRRIAQYAVDMRAAEVPTADGAALARRCLDAIGCALGGLEAEPCKAARHVAATTTTSSGCSVFGMRELVAAEQATFANTAMVRQLDYNDSYRGGGHPSDMIPGIIAAAELVQASGHETIAAIFTAYEVFGALQETYAARDAGWDQGAFIALSVAAAVAALLGGGPDQVANAASVALTSNMALHSTRVGELSQWKGCATAHGAMNGLLAARLALQGMTGPDHPFEGTDGLHRQIPPRGSLVLPVRTNSSAVSRTSIKRYPAVIHSQAVIECVLSMRSNIELECVESIDIRTYEAAWLAVGGGGGDRAEKWKPKTRETADHSLPYLVASALIDRDVAVESFSPDRLIDPARLALMQKTAIASDPSLTARFPDERASLVTIKESSGRCVEASIANAIGTPERPIGDEALLEKFRTLSRAQSSALSEEFVDHLLDLPNLKSIGELTRLFRRVVVRSASST